jgi:hypothetical protein
LEPSTWKKPLANQTFSLFSILRKIYEKLPNQTQFTLLLNGKDILMTMSTLLILSKASKTSSEFYATERAGAGFKWPNSGYLGNEEN